MAQPLQIATTNEQRLQAASPKNLNPQVRQEYHSKQASCEHVTGNKINHSKYLCFNTNSVWNSQTRPNNMTRPPFQQKALCFTTIYVICWFQATFFKSQIPNRGRFEIARFEIAWFRFEFARFEDANIYIYIYIYDFWSLFMHLEVSLIRASVHSFVCLPFSFWDPMFFESSFRGDWEGTRKAREKQDGGA